MSQIPSGTDLTIGRHYRITLIDPEDLEPSLKVGDIVLCATATAGCIDPENILDDGMGGQWLADFDAADGSFRTIVSGVEEVAGLGEAT